MTGNEYLYNICIDVLVRSGVQMKLSVPVDHTYCILGGADAEQPPDQDDAENQHTEPQPQSVGLANALVALLVMLRASLVGCFVNCLTNFLTLVFSFF